MAAKQFVAMCQAGGFQRILLEMATPSETNLDDDVSTAIDSFLRAWEA